MEGARHVRAKEKDLQTLREVPMQEEDVLGKVEEARQDDALALPDQGIDSGPPEVPNDAVFGCAVRLLFGHQAKLVEDELAGAQVGPEVLRGGKG